MINSKTWEFLAIYYNVCGVSRKSAQRNTLRISSYSVIRRKISGSLPGRKPKDLLTNSTQEQASSLSVLDCSSFYTVTAGMSLMFDIE